MPGNSKGRQTAKRHHLPPKVVSDRLMNLAKVAKVAESQAKKNANHKQLEEYIQLRRRLTTLAKRMGGGRTRKNRH
jgi:hypothetical protein